MSGTRATDITREVVCPGCETKQLERKWYPVDEDVLASWFLDKHNAPCGAPCELGSGISPTLRRLGWVHFGMDNCAACAKLAKREY